MSKTPRKTDTKKDKKINEEKQKKTIETLTAQFYQKGQKELDKDEFIGKLKDLFKLNDKPDLNKYMPLLETMFLLTDKDSFFHKKNSKIEKKEFKILVKAFPLDYENSIDDNPKRLILKIIFNMIDENHNGTLSRSEMAVLGECLKMEKSQLDQMFSLLGNEGNCELSEREFFSWFAHN